MVFSFITSISDPLLSDTDSNCYTSSSLKYLNCPIIKTNTKTIKRVQAC